MDQDGTSIGQSLNMKSHSPFTTGSFLAPVRLSSGAAAFAWQNLGRWGGSLDGLVSPSMGWCRPRWVGVALDGLVQEFACIFCQKDFLPNDISVETSWFVRCSRCAPKKPSLSRSNHSM